MYICLYKKPEKEYLSLPSFLWFLKVIYQYFFIIIHFDIYVN
ncbi:hypothetical protein CNEO2_320056 [Clostridium neonatale]|nr:hypothetical protein CNEO2_320056 [Clostridium neonatale]